MGIAMPDAFIQTAVDLDVILTGRLPSPVPYVFRPEGGNPVTRTAVVLRPGVATVDLACVAMWCATPTRARS